MKTGTHYGESCSQILPLRGLGQENLLCSSITTGETLQGLNFSDSLYSPSDFVSCFERGKEGTAHIGMLYSSPLAPNGCRDQLLEHRTGLRSTACLLGNT